MVTVTDYAIRMNGKGEEFIALILQGDLEMIQSKDSGRFYATTKKCSVSSTFTEEVAKIMLGKQLPGRVIKKECEPYEYTLPETGEVIQLTHRWEYAQEEAPLVPKKEVPVKPAVAIPTFSENGVQAFA